MNAMFGKRVIESVNATKAGDPVEVRRTWRERLLTRPWRPWVKTRTHRPMLPAMFEFADMWLVHPAVMRDLRAIADEASRFVSPADSLRRPLRYDGDDVSPS